MKTLFDVTQLGQRTLKNRRQGNHRNLKNFNRKGEKGNTGALVNPLNKSLFRAIMTTWPESLII
jgi:hypothetical protein